MFNAYQLFWVHMAERYIYVRIVSYRAILLSGSHLAVVTSLDVTLRSAIPPEQSEIVRLLRSTHIALLPD